MTNGRDEQGRERIRRLFFELIDMPPESRGAALARACGDDRALHDEVASLLDADAKAKAFMAEPTLDAGEAELEAIAGGAPILSEGPGSRIGPYKLLQLIGEGGFGSVFLAEQERPVVRKVALKIIKLGMDTKAVIARFEAERQALAMMDHPNIAKVLDAGATAAGRPYFVMELVKGDPIVAYCDRQNLPIEARLALFDDVCQAIQHAHTKGIIHRDIKPSNVLVSTLDGRPQARVIDFGIAKATAGRLTERTLFTEHRSLVGTPEYMSPEQAEGSLDIDTRTDVYSLGVLLYELLTGTTPFSSKELRSAAYAEIQRIIREVEPPKPSTRLSQIDDTIATVAARRHTEPRKLGLLIRGDLDWIVMRALEKDRRRRYESPNGLACDVRRFLAGEAVLAAPPSVPYRLRKFVRRHRGRVAAVGLVVAALVVGLIGTAWQAHVANRQRERAESQQAIAEAVVRFQQDMLASADPAKMLGDQVTVAEVMQTASAELDRGALGDQPLVQAAVRTTIGRTLRWLGRFAQSEVELRKALELRRQHPAAGDGEVIDSLLALYGPLLEQSKLDEAESACRDAIELLGRAPAPDRKLLGDAYGSLGRVLQAREARSEAEQAFRTSLEHYRSLTPPPATSVAVAMNNLAILLHAENRLDEAETLFRDALDLRRRAFPEGHPEIAQALDNLASLLQARGRFADAERLSRDALAMRRAALSADHPALALNLVNLSQILVAQHRLSEAEPLCREGLSIRERSLGADHPDTLRSLAAMYSLLMQQGKFADAEPCCRAALERRRRTLGDEHPDTISSTANMGELLQMQNRFADAEPFLVDALARRRRVLGNDHPDTLLSINAMAMLFYAQGRLAETEPFIREAVERSPSVLGPEHPTTLSYRRNFGTLLEREGKLAEAEPHVRWGLETTRRVQGPEHPDTLIAVTNMGRLLVRLGRPQEAVDLLLPAESAVRRVFTGDHLRRVGDYLAALGRARAALGAEEARFALAETDLLEAHAILLRARGERHADTLFCVAGLVDLYRAWGKTAAEAEWKARLDPTSG